MGRETVNQRDRETENLGNGAVMHGCRISMLHVQRAAEMRSVTHGRSGPPLLFTVHWPLFTVSIDLDFAQQAKIREHLAGPEHDRCQRIVGYGDGEAGFFADALVEVLDESAAAGKDDPAIGDIG